MSVYMCVMSVCVVCVCMYVCMGMYIFIVYDIYVSMCSVYLWVCVHVRVYVSESQVHYQKSKGSSLVIIQFTFSEHQLFSMVTEIHS